MEEVKEPSIRSKKGVRFHEGAANHGLSVATLRQEIERNTMISKLSIQQADYAEITGKLGVLELNPLPISHFNLFETPLSDKDQVKRVILFSDSPIDDQTYNNQVLIAKICDSLESKHEFEITKMQGQTITISDKPRQGQPQCVYQIVVQVQYLPYPFSFSKIITFLPKYIFVNKTYLNLYVIQSECEEKGLFKIYPMETSIFHWTDSNKLFEVNVKVEGYEFSGNMIIGQIGETYLRLRSSIDHESLILNVSISEENNVFYIMISDVSYAPPYRIENMTKTTFKISQKDSRSYDFELLKPFHITSFAWSYPLNEKFLSVSICTQAQDDFIGNYNVDSIHKADVITFKSRKSNKEYNIQILNEKTVKVIRILYAQNAINQTDLIKD